MTGPNIYIGGTSTTGAEGSWSWTDGSPVTLPPKKTVN